MATAQSNIKVTVVGDTKQFTRSMSGAQSTLKGMDKQIASLNKQMKAIKWGAIGSAAALGFTKLARGLNDVTKAAIADRRQQTALNKVLSNIPGISKKAIKANEAWIDSMQLATHVADTDLRAGIGRLIKVTGDLGEAQELAALAADVAAGKGISYARALKETEAAAKKGADEVNKLKDAYGGAAEAAAETDPYTKLGIIWDELQESLGTALLPLLDEFAKWFKAPANKKAVSDFIGRVGEIATGLGKKLVKAIKDVNWNKVGEDLKNLGEKFKTAAGYVKGLWDSFQALPPGVKDNIEKVLALFLGWKAASKVPGLSLLIDWNIRAIQNMLNRMLGTQFGVVGVRGNIVNVYGNVVGGKGGSTSPGGAAGRSASEVTDYAYINAKDAAIKAEMRAGDAAIQSKLVAESAERRAKLAEVVTQVRANRAAVEGEILKVKTMTAEQAARIDKINAQVAAQNYGPDIDGLKQEVKPKTVFKRMIGHIPLLGDILLIGADLLVLGNMLKRDVIMTEQKAATDYSNIMSNVYDADAELARLTAKAVAQEKKLREGGFKVTHDLLTGETKARRNGDATNEKRAKDAQADADKAYRKSNEAYILAEKTAGRMDAYAEAVFRKVERLVAGNVMVPMQIAYPSMAGVTPYQTQTATQPKQSMFTINVNSLVADKNTGREVVRAIQEYEYVAGKQWRK